MKKIAIPTKKEFIDGHFGHASEFTVFTINDRQILDKELVQSDKGCGCKSNIIQELKERGVSIMLAGNMGEGAYQKLSFTGLEVFRGCKGKAEEIVNTYLNKGLQDQDILCASHGKH